MKNKIEEIGYEKIDLKGLEIKPEWNIKWYNQKDGYSDGDIEDEIIIEPKSIPITKAI